MNNPYLKDSEPVEIIVIADRSGSMQSIKDDAIGGFNTFLQEQQKVEGEANLTLVLFDDQYEVPIESKPINEVAQLNEDTFVPRGMTALNDAIGKTIAKLREKNPKKAIVCIITDGMENCSREYTNAGSIKKLMEEVKDKGWEVIYLAANQDAFAEGGMRGIANNKNFTADSVGVRSAYSDASLNTTSYRNS